MKKLAFFVVASVMVFALSGCNFFRGAQEEKSENQVTLDDSMVDDDVVEDLMEENEDEMMDDSTIDESVSYISLTVEEAEELAGQNDIPFRVVMEDGVALPVTLEYLPGRINATVEQNVIVDVEVEGSEMTNEDGDMMDEVMAYDQNSWETMIPDTCESYFDGCNNCNREPNSDIAACTKKMCPEYTEPKCLDE